MPKRSSKPPADPNQAARSILASLTADGEADAPIIAPVEKNPAAVELGRRGGLKGGAARAAKLTAARKTEIAKAAAQKRWGK